MSDPRSPSSPAAVTVEDEITIVAKAIASGNYAGTTPNIRQLARHYLELRREAKQVREALKGLTATWRTEAEHKRSLSREAQLNDSPRHASHLMGVALTLESCIDQLAALHPSPDAPKEAK